MLEEADYKAVNHPEEPGNRAAGRKFSLKESAEEEDDLQGKTTNQKLASLNAPVNGGSLKTRLWVFMHC